LKYDACYKNAKDADYL